MNLTRRELVVFGLLISFLVVLNGLLLWSAFKGPGIVGFGGIGPGTIEPPAAVSGPGLLWRCLIFLIPLSLIALLGGGIRWWLTAIRGPQQTPQSPKVQCPNCNRPVQADWHVCPYCAISLLDADDF
jgi:hypothetical protein